MTENGRTNKQTEILTDKQIDRQTARQTDRQTDTRTRRERRETELGREGESWRLTTEGFNKVCFEISKDYSWYQC